MNILLVAGLWLDGSAWDEVAGSLKELSHHPEPLTLPGQGDGSTAAALDDQMAAVLAAVDASPTKPVVVAHSAACSLAWLAADARPESIDRIVLVGGFPAADGTRYADFFEITDGVMPFPGWAPFDGPDTADLDEPTRQRITAATVSVPEQVARGVVSLTDERRFDVPVVLVCPEFTPEEAKGWIDGGEVPELARVKDLRMVDIESGHWPMFSRPRELAELIASATDIG